MTAPAGSKPIRRDFSCFIGVDLGGGKGKNTAVALLRADDDGVRVRYVGTKNTAGQPYYDRQLLELIDDNKHEALLAIDAPLTRTVCMRCRLDRCPGLDACPDPVTAWFRDKGNGLVRVDGARSAGKPPTTPYTQRACEVILQRCHGVMPRETLGQGTGPLTARAHYLTRALEGDFEVNRNLIEVYPKATAQMLFGTDIARRYKRSVDTWSTRAEMLEGLGQRLRFEVWREGCLRNDHCFDAVLCAYTGYLWATEGWMMPEDDAEVFARDGWIWFPDPQTRLQASGDEQQRDGASAAEQQQK